MSVGVYISDENPEDQDLFVTEKCCFFDLVEGLSSPCPCGLTMKPWALESVVQVRTHKLMSTLLRLLAFVVFRKDMYCEHYSPVGAVIDSKGPGLVCECSVDCT